MTEKEIAVALTYSANSPFYCRYHLVVPNVYWGLGFNHELDLLSVSRCNIGTEVEIKISKADLIRDLNKPHRHLDPRIRQIYFAGPQEMETAFFEYTPADAGIITVYENQKGRTRRWQCSIRRNAKARRKVVAFTDAEIRTLLRLGNMRYWKLLEKVIGR